MQYLIDANILIESKKRLPSDVYVSLWKRFEALITSGDFVISVKVRDEIFRLKDELTEWCISHTDKKNYVELDTDIMGKYAATQRWAATCGKFQPSAISEYADDSHADAFLVATASAKDMTLVTLEKSEPSRRNRVKIPDACIALKVKCCNLNDAFRALKVTI